MGHVAILRCQHVQIIGDLLRTPHPFCIIFVQKFLYRTVSRTIVILPKHKRTGLGRRVRQGSASLDKFEIYFAHRFFFIVNVFARSTTLLHLMDLGKNESDHFIFVLNSFVCQRDVDRKGGKVSLASCSRSTI